MAKRKKASVDWPEVKPEDITVVYEEDPVWDPAHEELSKRGDPTAIARLLRSRVPMPSYIGRSLGIMLDPPKGYKGVRLRSSGKAGVKQREAHMKKLLDRRRQAEQLQEFQGDCKVETAAADAKKELGISRTTFFDKKKFDDLDMVFESQKMLGEVDRRDTESGKSEKKPRTPGRKSGKK